MSQTWLIPQILCSWPRDIHSACGSKGLHLCGLRFFFFLAQLLFWVPYHLTIFYLIVFLFCSGKHFGLYRYVCNERFSKHDI